MTTRLDLCEWCEKPAKWRYWLGDCQWFTCSNTEHQRNVLRLIGLNADAARINFEQWQWNEGETP